MNMSDMTKKLYPVTGMHCAACAGNVEKIVRKQEGVENASVNLATATLTVTYNPDIVSPQQLKEAVMKIGFDLIIDEDNSVQEQEEAEQSYYGQLKRKTIVAWIFALPVAVLGMFLMNVPGVNWWMLLLSLPVILYSGRSFYMNAWKQTLQRTSNMDTLVALSTSIAFLFSFFANKKYTFKTNGTNLVREMILFVVVTLTGLWVLQTLVIMLTLPWLTAITNQTDVALLVAKLLATVVSMTWNYLLYTYIVFKKH